MKEEVLVQKQKQLFYTQVPDQYEKNGRERD